MANKDCNSCDEFNKEYGLSLQGYIECAIWDGAIVNFCGWVDQWMQLYPRPRRHVPTSPRAGN